MKLREQADVHLQNRHSLSVEFLKPFYYRVAQSSEHCEVSAVDRVDALI